MEQRQNFSADEIPIYPASWYLFCASRALRPGPISKDLFGRKFVAFRTASGRAAIMDGRCVHLGADLGRGRVVGDAIQCPFHNWEFGSDGRCARIPAAEEIPQFARQACFPVEERAGNVYFFHGPRPLFPLPFFDDCRPQDFVRAAPFRAVIDCPWYMIGANAVDVQHFLAAHDRRLNGEPVVEYPAEFAHRTTSTFVVDGDCLSDRLLRRFAGEEVTMQMTDWGGTLMFVRATFRRTRSYGMLASLPLSADRTLAHVTVFARRSPDRFRQALVDPLNVWVRRLFIKKFLSADIERLAGTRFNPHTLIEIDQLMGEYFQWLACLGERTKQKSAAIASGSEDESVSVPSENVETMMPFAKARQP